ncbi:MAG: single-stranded DNA-binding protein, partial [Zhenhengia sp.]
MNQVTLLGNLTKDPELKKSKDTDVSYTQFTLAVHE